MEQLLIVEDDRGLSQGLCKALSAPGRQPLPCQSLAAAREQLLCGSPSLVLLDINLPDGSGLDFLAELRRDYPSLPVILLTANDTDMDIVAGLEQGADDYITKPFSLAVLRARVNAQLRRKAGGIQVFQSGPFSFDFGNMAFYAGGRRVELSKTEQKLLALLVAHPGQTLSRGELVDRIWSDGADFVEESALSVTVKRLRDKLGAGEHIKTVYGLGYSWVSHG